MIRVSSAQIVTFLLPYYYYSSAFLPSFQDLDLTIYNSKGSKIGTVKKPEKVSIGAHKEHVIDFDALLKLNLKQILDMAGDCMKHKQHTTFKVEGTVKGSALGFDKVVNLGPFEGDAKCVTPEDVMNQVLNGGGIVDAVESVTDQLPFGHEVNSIINGFLPGGGKKKKEAKQKKPAPAPAADNDVEAQGGRMLRSVISSA